MSTQTHYTDAIQIHNPKTLSANRLPAQRIPLGVPGDYKPCIAQLKTWVGLVADPTDLGSLAGLNAYGHDWLRGKCTEIYWESQQYGKMLD